MNTDTAPAVSCTALSHGRLADFANGRHPTLVFGWKDASLVLSADDDPRLAAATHFGYVLESAELQCESGGYALGKGMYFAVPGECTLRGGCGLVTTRLDFRGFFHLGGPIESRGRLRYIDGCSDSLLIPPVVRGAACLNLLHVPARTDQTRHTHPSLRVGVIVRGAGVCRTVQGDLPLSAATVFLLPEDAPHSFHTTTDELQIVAYHPDSDSGPTDDDHPMLNRTILHHQST